MMPRQESGRKNNRKMPRRESGRSAYPKRSKSPTPLFRMPMRESGRFPQNLISKISLTAEQFLIDRGEDKKIVKRVFSILLEGLNNIRIHGIRDELDRQLGYFILAFNQKI